MYKNPETRSRLNKPDAFLGDVAKNKEAKDWPEPEDAARQDMLRECPAYMTFCEDFVKVVVQADTFKTRGVTSKLSGYMSGNLETFMVLLYVNNYGKWLAESVEAYPSPPPMNICVVEAPPPPAAPAAEGQNGAENNEGNEGSSEDNQDEGDHASAVSTITGGWTNGSKGSGLHGGWSDDAFELYNYLLKILLWQRREGNNDERIKDLQFEEKLLNNLQEKAGNVAVMRHAKKRKLTPLSTFDQEVIVTDGRWDIKQGLPEYRLTEIV